MKKFSVLGIVITALIGLASCSTSSTVGGYSAIDLAQISSEHYQEIADYMDDYLNELGYFPMEYSVEWIGYCNYSELYDIEEYEEMEIGGYYTYTANLSTGELATGRLSTYWGDGEEIEIVNLTVETLTEEKPIVEYSDEKIAECWETYHQLAYPQEG